LSVGFGCGCLGQVFGFRNDNQRYFPEKLRQLEIEYGAQEMGFAKQLVPLGLILPLGYVVDGSDSCIGPEDALISRPPEGQEPVGLRVHQVVEPMHIAVVFAAAAETIV